MVQFMCFVGSLVGLVSSIFVKTDQGGILVWLVFMLCRSLSFKGMLVPLRIMSVGSFGVIVSGLCASF